ncbi:MAG: hypothetical protein MUE42_15875 [Opitutaceae bacterium]|nr:hypothetical protein [Opitutaceae bacterium]
MFTATEQRAVFAILLHAALADGAKSDAERAALKRMTEGFPAESVNPWTIYQDVLAGRYPVERAAAELSGREARLLAYEMAVGVCDTDGPPVEAERAFLVRLRGLLGMETQAAAAGEAERAAEAMSAAAVPAAASAGAGVGAGAAAAAATAANAASAPRLVPVDTAAIDKRVLNHAILAGALELLPQSLATMAIVPVQMKLVYSVGKAHGYELDRGHIRDFLATAGAGLAAQAVEGYARKLIGGLVGGVLGKGMIGGLGRAAAGTGAGAAITFAATYAIGQLAARYAWRRRCSRTPMRSCSRTAGDSSDSIKATWSGGRPR